MGSHPINLAIRFLLEIAALLAVGVWGWQLSDGWFKFVLAPGIPIILAVIWGTFAVPNDPSRSGQAPVRVPGIIRLTIELVFFALATWALFNLAYYVSSSVLGGLTVLHYIVSYKRINWLIKQ